MPLDETQNQIYSEIHTLEWNYDHINFQFDDTPYFQDQADKIMHHQVQVQEKIHKLLPLVDVAREIANFL